MNLRTCSRPEPSVRLCSRVVAQALLELYTPQHKDKVRRSWQKPRLLNLVLLFLLLLLSWSQLCRGLLHQQESSCLPFKANRSGLLESQLPSQTEAGFLDFDLRRCPVDTELRKSQLQSLGQKDKSRTHHDHLPRPIGPTKFLLPLLPVLLTESGLDEISSQESVGATSRVQRAGGAALQLRPRTSLSKKGNPKTEVSSEEISSETRLRPDARGRPTTKRRIRQTSKRSWKTRNQTSEATTTTRTQNREQHEANAQARSCEGQTQPAQEHTSTQTFSERQGTDSSTTVRLRSRASLERSARGMFRDRQSLAFHGDVQRFGIRSDCRSEIQSDRSGGLLDQSGSLWSARRILTQPMPELYDSRGDCGTQFAPVPCRMSERTVGRRDFSLQEAEESRRKFGVASPSPHARRDRRERKFEPVAPAGERNGVRRCRTPCSRKPSQSSSRETRRKEEDEEELKAACARNGGKGKVGLEGNFPRPCFQSSTCLLLEQAQACQRQQPEFGESFLDSLSRSRRQPFRRAAASPKSSQAMSGVACPPNPGGSRQAARAGFGRRDTCYAGEPGSVEVLSSSSSEAESKPRNDAGIGHVSLGRGQPRQRGRSCSARHRVPEVQSSRANRSRQPWGDCGTHGTGASREAHSDFATRIEAGSFGESSRLQDPKPVARMEASSDRGIRLGSSERQRRQQGIPPLGQKRKGLAESAAQTCRSGFNSPFEAERSQRRQRRQSVDLVSPCSDVEFLPPAGNAGTGQGESENFPAADKYVFPRQSPQAFEKGDVCEPSTLQQMGKNILKHVMQHEFFQGRFDSATEGQSIMVKELFPLPLLSSVASAESAWNQCMIAGLNYLFAGRNCSFWYGDGTEKQKPLLDHVKHVSHLTSLWKGANVEADLNSLWRSRHVNSYGEEVHVAMSFRWDNIAPGLPPPGLAGIVQATEVSAGGILDLIMNPDDYLKDPPLQQQMKPPRVMVPPDAWDAVCEGLISRGICKAFPLKDAYQVGGSPLLSGLFGVPKNEVENGCEVLRLIMDLRPLNQISLSVQGDLQTLPLITQLVHLELVEQEVLLISCEDIKAMFYVVGVPSSWDKFLCFNRVIPSRFHPDSPHEKHVLTACVLPMGYLNSVAIAQHLHRNIIHRALASAGVSHEHELRRDASWPLLPEQFRVYLDNFDHLKRVNRSLASLLQGESPLLVERWRQEYDALRVPRNTKKTVSSQHRAEVQGALVDGSLGVAFPKPEKLAKYAAGALSLLKLQAVSRKQLQIVAGGLVYAAGFRKPMMSCLNSIWRHIANMPEGHAQPLPAAVHREILLFLMLLPMCHIDFRAQCDGLVTRSDASMLGGGICRSVGLSSLGQKAATLPTRGFLDAISDASSIFVVSFQDNVGSLRVALEALGAPVSGYVSVEAQTESNRVVEANWPAVVFVQQPSDITKSLVQDWSRENSRCSVVLLAGCLSEEGQDESFLREFFRVRRLLRQFFVWSSTRMLMEASADISLARRTKVSLKLQMLPFLLDTSSFSPVQRKQFFWFDWALTKRPDMKLFVPSSAEPGEFGTILATCALEMELFLNPGWRQAASNHKFCVFDAVHDDWENGVVHPSWGWRVLSAEEKEALLGFPRSYTEPCMNKAQINASHRAYDDCRHTLLKVATPVASAAVVLYDLLFSFDLCHHMSLQDSLRPLWPGQGNSLQSFLARPAVFQKPRVPPTNLERDLARKLASLASFKGTDVLLHGDTEAVDPGPRLRRGLPSKLWRWKVVAGWKWKHFNCQKPEHINKLELRAVYTTLKWRIERAGQTKRRFLHLLDTMVGMHILNKGRSSSVKMHSVVYRISALLLASGLTPIVAFVASKNNPADRPSRRPAKRKWAKGRS